MTLDQLKHELKSRAVTREDLDFLARHNTVLRAALAMNRTVPLEQCMFQCVGWLVILNDKLTRDLLALHQGQPTQSVDLAGLLTPTNMSPERENGDTSTPPVAEGDTL